MEYSKVTTEMLFTFLPLAIDCACPETTTTSARFNTLNSYRYQLNLEPNLSSDLIPHPQSSELGKLTRAEIYRRNAIPNPECYFRRFETLWRQFHMSSGFIFARTSSFQLSSFLQTTNTGANQLNETKYSQRLTLFENKQRQPWQPPAYCPATNFKPPTPRPGLA